MAATDQPFSGRLVAGRYRLGPRRGSGVDAAVFDAYDEQLERIVSLKVVHPDLSADPEFQRSFRATMDIAASLHHPNIAAQYDYGRDSWNGRETLYVVVEQLTGGSLRDVLDRGRLLSQSQALSVGLDACKALDVIHRAGLIHGDIRPSTLVFGDDRRLRLIDVGLGQLLSEVLWSGRMHVGNDRAMYASPEVGLNQPAVPRSDVYSLCLTMLESVTGHVPFVGDSTVSTLANRVGKLLPVSADLGALAAVLERAGRPEADDRYSAAEFGRALMQTAEKLPRPAPMPILVSGFSADRTTPGQREDPTGPVQRPASVPPPVPAADAAPVEPSDVAGLDEGVDDELDIDADVPNAVDTNDVDTADVDTADVDPNDVDTADVDTGPPTAAMPSLAFAVPSGPATTLPPPPPPVVVPVLPGDAIDDGGPATQAMPAIQPVDRTALMPVAEPLPPTEAVPATPAAPPPAAGVGVFDEQWPPRRSRRRFLWLIPIIAVLAAAGIAIAYVATRTVSHTVPALAGKSQGEALNQVSGLGWKVATAQAADETVKVGDVISTDPVAGTKLAEGKTFTIVVSTGPAPRPLPELKGLTLQAATDALTKLGLEIQQGDQVFDDTIPAGSVVSWMVPEQPALVAGDTVTPGVTISVQLSKGPAPRLPELNGQTVDAATALLAAQQLTIKVADPVFDEIVPAGQVLSWSVPSQPTLVAGAVVDPGTVVQVVPSGGPAPRAVPNLVGMAPADAQAAVEALGLVWAQLPDEFSPTVPAGQVARQDPVADTSVARGTTISAAVSKGPDLVAVPALAGLALQPAIDAITSAGLAVGTVTGNSAGVVTAATVGGVAVAVGQTEGRGTAIDLTLT